jgi:putative ABC transport system ATP-binding protein
MFENEGMGNRIYHYPNEFSGEQRQKVTAATAIVKNPLLILADELTGNLDTKTGLEIINLLEETIQNQDATIVQVTFDMETAELSHQIFKLKCIIK